MKEETTSLILLGLLQKKSIYGYDTKKILRQYDPHAHIPFSTLYHSLKKLEKQGFIKQYKDVKSARPTKHLYKITKEGKRKFYELLKAHIKTDPEAKEPDPFCVGMWFSDKLPKKELNLILLQRITALEQLIEKLKEHPCQKLLIERAIMHINTEIKWLRKAK